MKYSLKTLMIVVTLVGVVLGSVMARVEYLRRWAEFHEGEAKGLVPMIMEMTEPNPPGENSRRKKKDVSNEEFLGTMVKFIYHEKMQERYSAAIYCPWVPIYDDKP